MIAEGWDIDSVIPGRLKDCFAFLRLDLFSVYP
ncbi:MAG: hypothetical protein A4E57_02553 [Syntrophorhabdaceae bacterium PtaU1.Bin034]|nr:MAG: hypothetical protein A4E57_02553 [Syntrophorhabdaceae bacterium PtaU1.Bin034]